MPSASPSEFAHLQIRLLLFPHTNETFVCMLSEGYWFVSPSIHQSVTMFSATTCNKVAKGLHQHVQLDFELGFL